MRQAGKVSLSLVIIFSFAASLLTAAKKEYFTEDEQDLIREAQELSQRVPVYFKLAERRLIFLGLMEKRYTVKGSDRGGSPAVSYSNAICRQIRHGKPSPDQS